MTIPPLPSLQKQLKAVCMASFDSGDSVSDTFTYKKANSTAIDYMYVF